MALVLLSALVFALAWQNREQNARWIRHQQLDRNPRTLAYVPAFHSRTLDGDSVLVGERADSGRQVLFIFNTKCAFCVASIPEWRRVQGVLDTLATPRTTVLGIALDTSEVALKNYLREHQIPYPVLRFPSRKMRTMYRTGNVPATIVLSADGRVIYAHVGVLEGHAVGDSVLAAVRYRGRIAGSVPALAAAR